MELRVCPSCRHLRASGTSCGTCHGPLQLTDGAVLVGETFGKYRIDDVLGAGGMGVVYRATHLTLERQAAIKIVVPAPGEEEFEKRFLREAKLLAELKHPSIVDVYDFDVSSWGVPYLVMELLTGVTLRQLAQARDGKLEPAMLSPILADVAAGLAFAHEKGIVHRDLKPENVFVATYHDRAVGKILDFGIAKIVAQGRETSRLTMSGVLVGTPFYLSPEQLLAAPIGPAVDQYALALIVAEVLSGQAVREGKTLGQIYAVDIQKPVAAASLPPGLPSAVAAAVERATEPAPESRFPSIAAFVEALALPPSDGRQLLGWMRGAAAPAPSGVQATTPLPRPMPSAVSPPPRATTVPLVPADTTPGLLPTERHGTPPPVAAAVPPAAPAIPDPRPAWALLALGAVVLITGGLLLYRSRVGAGGVLPATAGSAKADAPAEAVPAAAPEAPGLHLVRELHVPADAQEVLGVRADAYLLRATSGIYMLPPDGDQPATPVAIDGRIVGGGPEGRLDVLEKDGALVRRDVEGKRRQVLVTQVPEDLARATVCRVSPGGDMVAFGGKSRVEVHRVKDGGLARAFSVDVGDSREPFVALGRRLVAVVQGEGGVKVHALDDGRALLDVPFPEQKLFGIALLEDAGLLAVCGWFDRVLVYDVARPQDPPRALKRQGPTVGVGFLPDHPTIVTIGGDGLRAHRIGSELPAAMSARSYEALYVAADQLLALDARAHVLSVGRYVEGPVPDAVAVSRKSLWALAEEPVRRMVLAGSSDGTLFCMPPGSKEAFRHELHTDGITAMARHRDHLATASDDKTIAVWKLPELDVLWRSKAHGFLVNYLRIQGEPPSLWSASSDGALKQWDFPQLEERRTISTEEVTGRKRSLAAFWISPSQDRILAGTWQNALLDLRQGPDGKWKATETPMESAGIYQIVDLPGVSALLVIGIEPSTLHLMDLERGTLEPAATLGVVVKWGEPLPGGSEAWIVGEGAVMHYRLERGASGRLGYEIRSWVHTDFGTLQAATILDGGKRFAVGNERGEVRVLELDPGKREPLAKVTVAAGDVDP